MLESENEYLKLPSHQAKLWLFNKLRSAAAGKMAGRKRHPCRLYGANVGYRGFHFVGLCNARSMVHLVPSTSDQGERARTHGQDVHQIQIIKGGWKRMR